MLKLYFNQYKVIIKKCTHYQYKSKFKKNSQLILEIWQMMIQIFAIINLTLHGKLLKYYNLSTFPFFIQHEVFVRKKKKKLYYYYHYFHVDLGHKLLYPIRFCLAAECMYYTYIKNIYVLLCYMYLRPGIK